MKKIEMNKAYNDAMDFIGTEKGDKARKIYELGKLEIDRKRNTILFYNAILLAIIALTNIVLAIMKFKSGT
ncbi:MAG: hypothetical protein LKG19_02440 [Saprospiraceae bacterium]|jgi:hypothetical protein|nr:hypothetical protein [Saprospiraceae bacterium]